MEEKPKLKKGDKVLLPFNGIGKIIKYHPYIWASKYIVKIFTNNTFYRWGEVQDFQEHQLTKI